MKKIIIILIALILLSSCIKTNEKININGKWSTLSKDAGYMEFEIDNGKIGMFSHYGGNLGLIEYKLLNDSLFIGSNTSFKVEKITDSLIILKNISQNDTLRKIDKTIMTYHEIDSKNDSLFNIFYERFEKRAYKKLIEKGDLTENDYKSHFKKID